MRHRLIGLATVTQTMAAVTIRCSVGCPERHVMLTLERR